VRISPDYKHLPDLSHRAHSLLETALAPKGIFFQFMRGKRRDPRFALTAPLEGSLRVPDDVIVERWNGSEVWVVSTGPARVDEVMTLDVAGSGPQLTLTVRVVESAPVLIDGVVRHGLRLAILP
jgi:hypothetical protein